MKLHSWACLLSLAVIAMPALSTVTVTSPLNGAKVTTPVHFVATATSTTCSEGVASMGIYVNDVKVYVVDGASLNTEINIATGTQKTTIEEWDKCGGATTYHATLTVEPSTSTTTTVKISAGPTSIVAGSPSTLTVTATHATEVTIAGSDGTSYQLANTGGAQQVTPTATTTYTATATGPSAAAKATATVKVTPSQGPHVSISVYPPSIAEGSSSTLTVTATNATGVTVAGSDGSSYTLAGTGGTQIVTPAATTTYTATGTETSGNATAATTLTVIPGPPTEVSISASPSSVVPGGSSTLAVTAAYAATVAIYGSDGSIYRLGTTGGKQLVTPAATTTYQALAEGATHIIATTIVTVTSSQAAQVSIAANPFSIAAGSSSTLTVTASSASAVTLTGTDGSSYTLQPSGGTETVTPSQTTTYTAEATGTNGNGTAQTVVTVVPASGINSIDHVIFMLQENHSFDDYFGMLNPYRQAEGFNIGDDGVEYDVDGIDDKLDTISNQDDAGTWYSLYKLKSTCIDDDSSAWGSSYGDVNRYDFLTTRPIQMDGFVHTAENFSTWCAEPGAACSGTDTDLKGTRAMGYYDESFLNYYYYMASQFAVSDRWFSPVASESIDNRIATYTGGTTQGLVQDPGANDHLPQLAIETIFNELDKANVSWKIYYTVTEGFCLDDDECPDSGHSRYPATNFSALSYSNNYLHDNKGTCSSPTVGSKAVGDSSNSFCIDIHHIAPLSTYFSDLANGTLPSFAFIEAGYANNDEHPGSGQSILNGQAQVAKIVNALLSSSSWHSSVFFFGYDEGGGPYDHVPPVPGHSNDFTDESLGNIPDIGSISVSPDGYKPCVGPDDTKTTHCDLNPTLPGANPGDAPAVNGFGAQIGFRIPNAIISPFTRRHYVSHTPMDHTAIIKFVENRFIGPSTNLTARDAAQPNLLEYFDFVNVPWATPPSPPTPVTAASLGYNPCTPNALQ